MIHPTLIKDKQGRVKGYYPKVRFMDVAWIRDAAGFHTGEAMLIATLLHTTGEGRQSADAEIVHRLMQDVNMENE